MKVFAWRSCSVPSVTWTDVLSMLNSIEVTMSPWSSTISAMRLYISFTVTISSWKLELQLHSGHGCRQWFNTGANSLLSPQRCLPGLISFSWCQVRLISDSLRIQSHFKEVFITSCCVFILSPELMFAKRDKHYPSRSGQASLTAAVTNLTKHVTRRHHVQWADSAWMCFCVPASVEAYFVSVLIVFTPSSLPHFKILVE